ncbi:MAG: fibronectin type III domain-containing protein [Methanomassiliicoccales archaeon]
MAARLVITMLVLSSCMGGLLLFSQEASGDGYEGSYYYEVIDNGTAVMVLLYDGPGGDIVIPSEIDGKPVTVIGSNTFFLNSGITSVTIPASVKRIETSAIYRCLSLTSMFIPSTVEEIAEGAFNECLNVEQYNVDPANPKFMSEDGVLYGKAQMVLLQYPIGSASTTFTVPDNVSRIADRSFMGADQLTTVTLGNGVFDIGNLAFCGCTGLTSMVIPDEVTAIGEFAFSDCTNVATVTLSASLQTMGMGAFYTCTSLVSVTLPSGLEYVGKGIFSDCTSLQEILVDESSASFISLEGVLYDRAMTTLYQYPCGKNNTSYTVPEGVTNITDDAFVNNLALASVTLPDTLESIGTCAFLGCEALFDIYFLGDAPAVGDFWYDSWTNPMIHHYARYDSFTTYPWQNMNRQLIPLSAPTSPLNLQGASQGDHVMLTWNEPAHDGGADVDYYLVYQDGELVKTVNGLSTKIYGLDDDQTYTFVVVAHNSAGNSTVSSAMNLTFVASDVEGTDPPLLIYAIVGIMAVVVLAAVVFLRKRR